MADATEQLRAWLDGFFVSGNAVPVERATIRAELWGVCKDFIDVGRPLVHHEMESVLAQRKWEARQAAREAAMLAGGFEL